MSEQSEDLKRRISEARSLWKLCVRAGLNQATVDVRRRQVVALVDELRTLNGSGPANVEKPSTAVRLHALGRLCARWREESARIDARADKEERRGEEYLAKQMRTAAQTLRGCAYDLESGWAGTEPTDQDQVRHGREDVR